MEGCPKVLMISFDTKEPAAADFTAPITSYIQDFYHENPDSYKNEIQQINQLKKNISNVTRDNQGCSAYRKYYAQLQFLQSRFPMGSGGAASLPLVWYDVYTGDPVTQKDIRFEQACVLFNLGGLYSQLGANESRTSDESMKVACTYFQCAAGAFQYLKENFSLESFPDMAGDVPTLKSTIMLCQAQECLLEKSIRDNRKCTLIARISIQIKDYYQDAVKLLEGNGTSEMGSQLRKSWTKHLQMKINMYTAIAYIYMSNEADEGKKFGEKLAYLKAASEKINEAVKTTKNQPDQVMETLRFLQDVVGNKLDAAVKENDFVYHALVPDMDKLPEIKGVSLVKAMPFQYNDPSISGPDIFQKLIPMKAHESSSLYSEEKAGLLRKITSEIEEKNLYLSESLSSMHIDDLMNPVEEVIPENLSQKCKELRNVSDIVSTTEDQIKELAMLSEEFEVIFNEIASVLKNEEEFEREAKLGDSDRGTSKELEDLKKEFTQCIEVNEQARNTNMTLCNHFEESKEIIELLCGPDDRILASLPSQNFIDAPIDEPVVQRIRELLGAVEKMKNQRATVEKQFRDQLNKDDITSLLVIKEDGNQENFFKDQLKKHDEMVAIIRQNLSAQDNILLQLTEENAKYAPTRIAAVEIAARRNVQVQSYINHTTLFLEVRERLVRGLKFYRDLKETLKILEKKVAEFCRKREKDKVKFKEIKKKDAPPPRPTAAKPTFDRSAKPTGSQHAPSLSHDNMFTPISPNFLPSQLPANLQRPQGSIMPPVGPYQNMPPGAARPQFVQNPRMVTPSTVPNSGGNIPPMPVSQSHVEMMMRPRVPGTVSGTNIPQRFDVRAPLDTTQSMFPAGPQNDNFRQRFPHDNRLPQNQPRFSASGPLPNLPQSPQFQQVSTNFSRPQFVQPPQNQTIPLPGQPLQPQMPPQMPMQPPSSQVRQSLPNHMNQMRRGSADQAPFPVDQHGQQLRPVLQPQGIRSPDHKVMQPRFSAPDQRNLPPLERPAYGGQPPMQRPPNPNMMMPRQEFRPRAQQIQNLDQAHGLYNVQQPQRQQLPGVAQQPPNMQYRPQTPQQVVPQDTRFAFEMQSQLQGPQRGSSQVVGPRFGGLPDKNFVSNAQTVQGHRVAFAGPMGNVPQFMQGQVSPGDQFRFPAMQQQQQQPRTDLRLPEPLLPEKVVTPQNLMDREDNTEINKAVDLLPTPASLQQNFQQPNPLDPNPTVEMKIPKSVGSLNNPIASGQMNPQSPFTVPENKESRPPSRPVYNEVPSLEAQPEVFRNMYADQTEQPRSLSGGRELPGNLVQRQISDNTGQSNFQLRNQYAYQGPMSSPTPECSQPSSFQSEPSPLTFQQRPAVTQIVSDNAQGGNRSLPTAPPLVVSSQNTGVYNPPPPFSSSRPFDLITMNNRPVMATAQTSDSVISGILGSQTQGDRNQPDIMQMGFQQFQMQQMILQQQQLISMIQNQQSQQKAAETMQIEKLQQQILDQQKVIEQLANEQHKLLDQQQHSSHLSHDNSQEYMQMQMRQQQFQMLEQQEQLLQQRSLLMQLQSSRPMGVPFKDRDSSKQNLGLSTSQTNVVSPAVDLSSSDKSQPVKSVSKLDNSLSPLSTSHDARDYQTSQEIPSNIDESKVRDSKIVPSTKASNDVKGAAKTDMESLASSVLSAFDVSLSSETSSELTSKISMSTSAAFIEENKSPSTEKPQSTNELLNFDISQFEEEMHAVLSGSQDNSLKTPVSKTINTESNMGQFAKEISSFSISESDFRKDSVSPRPSGEKSIDSDDAKKHSDTPVRPENSPPFYEPMLDAEQKLKHVSGQLVTERAGDMGVIEKPTTETQNVPKGKTDAVPNDAEVKDSLLTSDSLGDSHTNEGNSVGSVKSDFTESGKSSVSKDTEKEHDISATELEQKSETLKLDEDASVGLMQNDSSVEKASDALPRDSDAKKKSNDIPNNISIPSMGTTEITVDEAASPSPSRPQFNRQEGRLSFYQAVETAEERRAYLEDLDEAVEQMHQQCMDLCKRITGTPMDGFTKLWNDLAQVEELDSCSFSAEAGKSNVNKNRYRDILPWDHTRVLLKSLPNDYINANHIDNLTQCSPRYIASQGPIPQCFEDFWTMVWEQRCPVIVMLTNEMEGTKLKCHRYWPKKLEQTTEYGALCIYLSEQEAGPSWRRRTQMKQGRSSNYNSPRGLTMGYPIHHTIF
eukprot:gene13497-4376_t